MKKNETHSSIDESKSHPEFLQKYYSKSKHIKKGHYKKFWTRER